MPRNGGFRGGSETNPEVENVTLFNRFHTHGNDVSLLASAFTVGIIETHRAVFIPGSPTALDHSITIKGAQFADSTYTAVRPFLQTPRPIGGGWRKVRCGAFNNSDELYWDVILVILVHAGSPLSAI
jgi:hypothetical protein